MAEHRPPCRGSPSVVVVTGFSGERLCKQLGNSSFKMLSLNCQVRSDFLLKSFHRRFNLIFFGFVLFVFLY